MTRKDIIMMATLANIGVLALLFMLAFRSQNGEDTQAAAEIAYQSLDLAAKPAPVPVSLALENRLEPIDEVDAALEELTPLGSETSSQTVREHYAYQEPVQPPVVVQPLATVQLSVPPVAVQSKYVEVTVKRGDSLDKIARGNGTSIKVLMEVNNLPNDRLKVGQVLRIPIATVPAAPAPPLSPRAVAGVHEQYYIMKSGDSPWKIAKQFDIDVNKLMELNNLDEESARKLKIGDRVRVK